MHKQSNYNNQITRDEALKIIKQPAYDLKNIHNDIEYFLKKMEWSKVKFDKYLKEKRYLIDTMDQK